MPQAGQVVLIFGVIARPEGNEYSILAFDFGTFGQAEARMAEILMLFPERSLNPIPYCRFKYISVYVF